MASSPWRIWFDKSPPPSAPPSPSGIQIGLAANYRDGHFIHVHFPVVVWGLPICILISVCTCYMYGRLAVDWLISLVISILISCAHAFNPLALVVSAPGVLTHSSTSRASEILFGHPNQGLSRNASSVSFGHAEHCFSSVWTPKILCQNLLKMTFLRR